MFADGSVNPLTPLMRRHGGDIHYGDGASSPPSWPLDASNNGVCQCAADVSITVGGIAVAQPFAFIGIPSWSVE